MSVSAFLVAYVVPSRAVSTELSAGDCLAGPVDGPIVVRVVRDDRGVVVRATVPMGGPPRVQATLSRGTLRIWVYGVGEETACRRAVEIRPQLHAEPVTRVVLESRDGVLAETAGP